MGGKEKRKEEKEEGKRSGERKTRQTSSYFTGESQLNNKINAPLANLLL